MSQADLGTLVASETSGTELAARLRSWRDAQHTTHSGNARPSYAQPGQLWINTAANPWKVMLYTGTSDAPIISINPTNASTNLDNVDNTSDANKPISNAGQTALNGKVNREANVVGLGDVVVAGSWTQIYARMSDNSVRKLVTDISENRMAMYYGAGFPIVRVDSTDFQIATRQYAVEQYNAAIAANQHDVRELRWTHAGENPVTNGAWNTFGQSRNIYGILLNGSAGVAGLRISALQAYSFDRGWFTIEG